VNPYWWKCDWPEDLEPFAIDSSWLLPFGTVFHYPRLSTHNGYMYLNISSNQSAYSIERSERDLYAGLEIRLRCSDDNKLNSSVGGGFRSWGFSASGWFDGIGDLWFESYSPDSDSPLPGFWATSTYVSDEDAITSVRKPIVGIDMTEWHTYTILWGEGDATFLIDGVIVARTDRVPTSEMGIMFFLTDKICYEDQEGKVRSKGYLELELDQSIQIDYVHVFTTEE
jgi:hypothetical protein